MKEKYVKPVVVEEGKSKNFYPAAAAFVAGVEAGKAVKHALGVIRFADRYAVLEVFQNRVAME